MNAHFRHLFVLLALLAAVSGCRRTDVRDFAVEIPGAREADMPAISHALAKYAGVKRASLVFDARTHVLRMKYDSMQVAKKNIEMAIAELGLTANGVTPESIGRQSRK